MEADKHCPRGANCWGSPRARARGTREESRTAGSATVFPLYHRLCKILVSKRNKGMNVEKEVRQDAVFSGFLSFQNLNRHWLSADSAGAAQGGACSSFLRGSQSGAVSQPSQPDWGLPLPYV